MFEIWQGLYTRQRARELTDTLASMEGVGYAWGAAPHRLVHVFASTPLPGTDEVRSGPDAETFLNALSGKVHGGGAWGPLTGEGIGEPIADEVEDRLSEAQDWDEQQERWNQEHGGARRPRPGHVAKLRCCASEPVMLLAEATGAEGAKLRRFSMVAYTGASMRLPGFHLPVVVDLQGMKVPKQKLPILRQHDPERIVGHTESVEVTVQRVKVSGVISGVSAAAAEVTSLAANGFGWGASIGAGVEKMEHVREGAHVTVNRRSFDGPLLVARSTVLQEISLVPSGADAEAEAVITGQRAAW